MGEKTTNSAIKFIKDMADLITNHGIFKIIESITIIALSISIFTIAARPEIILNQIKEIAKIEEIENREFRKVNDPLIRSELHDLMYETGGNRASILEFHNGKENPSGLGFLYADMTYDMSRDGYASVVSQYQDVNLSWLDLPTVLYENGYWYGGIEELKTIDPKLGCMMEKNGTTWVSFLLLTGSKDIGILILSFNHQPENIQHIGREIRRLGITIAAKLDYENRGV